MNSAASKPNIRQTVPFFMVSSMEESLRFYLNGLGFRKTKEWVVDGKVRWCWLELEAVALMLQEHGGELPSSVESRGKAGAGVSICYQCDDALAFRREIQARGIATMRPFVGNNMWVVNIADPDGYRLSFESPTDAPEESELSEES